MCEAFGCVPSVAERELDQNAELIFDILDLRSAASAYRAYKSLDGMDAKTKRKVLQDEYVQEVQAADFAKAKEAIANG